MCKLKLRTKGENMRLIVQWTPSSNSEREACRKFRVWELANLPEIIPGCGRLKGIRCKFIYPVDKFEEGRWVDSKKIEAFPGYE